MARTLFDGAIDGLAAYDGRGYFFLGGCYAAYDFGADRVGAAAPRLVTDFPLPAAFADRVDGGFNGAAGFANKAYLFRDNQYARYDWIADRLDTAAPAPMSAWSLPAPFDTGIDAALSGRGRFAGKGYLFKAGQYVRYDWAGPGVEGGPAPLTAWNLPAPFSSGIDAAVNGRGKYDGYAYFFKDEDYVRYDWSADTVSSGYPRKTADSWPGLVEMLQAGVATQVAKTWIAAARAALGRVADGTEPAGSIVFTALTAHFKADWRANLAAIRASFDQVAALHAGMPAKYHFVNLAEATRDKAIESPGKPYAAYVAGGATDISFSRTFANFGPMCQAAMVTHEAVHTFDGLSGQADIHLSEWHPDYPAQVTAKAIHNPSAYAAFSQHVFYSDDRRYGARRPND
ncbi:MAG: hypothetical protein E6J90_41440 [Deltaproteobacteria bacterium]|nr:MAG: hypothetical protein E6J90_41440 [Deltaproteobacteria bacterium]TMQ20058.1 MAG: hypothetical protein E6J91_04685 [Deltaproteobacteria bacterium]